MSKNRNNQRPPGANVQADDTVKTAKDAEQASVSEHASRITGAAQAPASDGSDGSQADAAASHDVEPGVRDGDSAVDDVEDEGEAGRRAEEASDPVEARVLRAGYFGALNDVVTLSPDVARAAQDDGAVCTHPASVAEAKQLQAKGD